ncbi:replication endonuclease, partial [Escherichia coli]
LEHADHEVGETVNFDALSRQEKRELAQRLSDEVRSKRNKRPPEREEKAGLSVKEQQISELLALRGIDASVGMVRSMMAGASMACGDLVLTVQDGRLVSSNRAASGVGKLASEKMAVKKKSDELL